MRESFGFLVERCRLKDGRMGTRRGDTFGFFSLHHPRTMAKIKAMVGDGLGWDHVSVSIAGEERCPTWEEMCWVKDQFFEPSEAVMQIHPRIEDYVDYHPYCLHLWRPQDEFIPLPDPEMVGPRSKATS